MKNNENNFNDESNFPLDNNGKDSFDLPLDYFASFEDKLKKKLEQENELSEFPVLSSLKKINVFTAPENYFQSAQNSLEYKTELASYPKLGAIKALVFNDLEEDYKTQLQTAVNYKIELVDELKQYTTLYSIDKHNVFIIPQNYFENVAECLKDRIYATKESKNTVLNTILDFIFGKKMAFAFGILFIIALSVYFNQPKKITEESGDCKTLACLEKQEILNNKAISGFDEEQLIDLVDVNSLGKQLNLKGQKTDSLSQKEILLNDTNTDELLEEL
ncbi:MAG: hypothetical protein V4506_19100 [Bacteroidota bacterium]